jgi:hypothetical protein
MLLSWFVAYNQPLQSQTPAADAEVAKESNQTTPVLLHLHHAHQ